MIFGEQMVRSAELRDAQRVNRRLLAEKADLLLEISRLKREVELYRSFSPEVCNLAVAEKMKGDKK